MSGDENGLAREMDQLAQQFHGNSRKKRVEFVAWLRDARQVASGKQFLVIHNPGGWGCRRMEDCVDWEKSVVDGVGATMAELGYSWSMVQYFRSGESFWRHMMEVRKEAVFFFTGRCYAARVLAAGLELLSRHQPDLTVVLVGASQGAAFGNAVMRELHGQSRVYSIELGIFFAHVPRRVVTERTLALDTNGLMPDPMVHLNLWVSVKAHVRALVEWTRYRLQGKPTRYVYCIHNEGHEYFWDYPEVHGRIQRFLNAEFGTGRK